MGAYGAGIVALLEDCILEAWRPGAWRAGGKDDEAEAEDADKLWNM